MQCLKGLSEKAARDRFWIVDKDGLLDSDRRDLSDEQKTYARARNEIADWPRNQHGKVGLAEVVGKLDVTVLIGLSTVKGIFTESIVREMARKTERPIIFPLSNPTSHSEAEPSDLLVWTGGKSSSRCHWITIRISEIRWEKHRDRSMQQCVHLSRSRPRIACFTGPESHRQNDARWGKSSWRSISGVKRSCCFPVTKR
jgi:hypothetical protein